MIAPFTDLDERALKTMTGELVSACGGTNAVSKLLGERPDKPFSEARISGYCTVSDMGRYMPIRAVTKLEVAFGAPIVSRWMTERLTRDGAGTAGSVCVKDLCRILRETGDLQNAVGEAISDGHVDSADRAAIRAASADLRRALDDIDRKVEQP